MPAIAYLINQYPKVSHSFIRREIMALEEQGVPVVRMALRGWDAEVVDALDEQERGKTHYLLKDGVKGLLGDVLAVLRASPGKFFRAAITALKLGWRADRSMPYHLIYLAEACRVKRLCDEYDVAHAHAHFGTNPAEVLLLTHVLGGPSYSFTVHGPEEFDRPAALKLREKVHNSAFTVAISSYGRSQISRWVDFEQWPKIREVHCGLDAQYLQAPVTAVPRVPRFVCVGRLCEQKGQLLLMEAAGRLQREGVDFELVLAGDGEMRPEIEALIRHHKLENRVTITGWISSSEVAQQLEQSRVMVLPSFAEGLPVVIMEALAMGRPVISTYIAGIPELITDRECGWLIPAGSVDALVDAMREAVEATPETMARMAEEGRRRVTDRHNITTEAARLRAYFGEVTGLEWRGSEKQPDE